MLTRSKTLRMGSPQPCAGGSPSNEDIDPLQHNGHVLANHNETVVGLSGNPEGLQVAFGEIYVNYNIKNTSQIIIVNFV